MSNPLILQYQQRPTPELEGRLLAEYDPYIKASAKKWRGSLPDAVIDAHAKNHAIEALRTYDPNKGDINTHISSKMQRLGRLNYEHSNVARIPEHQIRHIGKLKQQQAYLTDILDREPTPEELAKVMKMPKSQIKRMVANLRGDLINDSDTEFSGPVAHDHTKGHRLASYRHDLSPLEQKQFDHLTGYGGVKPLKPTEFGRLYGLKPYQVTRLKNRHAQALL